MKMSRSYCAVALALMLAGCQSKFIYPPAPDFTLSTLNGQVVTRSNVKSKAVLICFWAVHCVVCGVEAPNLKEIHQKYGPRGLTILAVNAWNEPQEMVASYVNDEKLPYTVLLNGREVFREMYAGRTVPRNFLLNADGRIVVDQEGGDLTPITNALDRMLR